MQAQAHIPLLDFMECMAPSGSASISDTLSRDLTMCGYYITDTSLLVCVALLNAWNMYSLKRLVNLEAISETKSNYGCFCI